MNDEKKKKDIMVSTDLFNSIAVFNIDHNKEMFLEHQIIILK